MSGWTFLFNQGVGCAACRGEPVLCSEEVSAELGLLLKAGLTPKPAFRSAPSRPQPALFCVQDQGLCIIYLRAHEKPKLSATVGHDSITAGVLGENKMWSVVDSIPVNVVSLLVYLLTTIARQVVLSV